ncbi:MAG: hypothetical protein NDF54_09925 [archaeon GB-1867-035]|nr:hypothetical protein [Candidatus Culexmicrobium profundum]
MEKESIIVLAKTYPELSKKYGPLVCVAGVNEYGELRRLYPIPYKIWIKNEYKEIRFKKWDIIEAELTRPQSDPRKESRKVTDWRKIKIKGHIKDWSLRLYIINELLEKDIESIKASDSSLGVIKPSIVEDFLIKERQKIRDPGEIEVLEKMDSTTTLLAYFEKKDQFLLPDVWDKDVKIEKIPWIGHKFYCKNPLCKGHEMMVIDWEAQELFRKYRMIAPVKEKLFNWMLKERKLYFVIGNTWRWKKSFMIISLFYPPKKIQPISPLQPVFKKRAAQREITDYMRRGSFDQNRR